VIEGVEAGIPPSQTLKEDPRNIDKGKFYSWMNRDPERKKRFDEAKVIGALVMEDMLLERINGDSLEDVQRAKLAVDTLKWLMQVNNRKRYGADKEHTTSFADGGITIVINDVPTGRVSEKQKEWMDHYEAQGWKVAVWRSADEAINGLKEYLG
jgi:hypothetical protein